MKHRIRHLDLNRDTAHRIALVKNLTKCMFQHGYLETTKSKVYSFIPYASKFITALLKRDRLSAIKFAKERICGCDKIALQNVLSFYDQNIQQERKTNYIGKKRVFNKQSNSADTIVVYLL